MDGRRASDNGGILEKIRDFVLGNPERPHAPGEATIPEPGPSPEPLPTPEPMPTPEPGAPA